MPGRKKAKRSSSPTRRSKKKSVTSMYQSSRGRRRGNARKSSLWDLERDGVTFSMLSKFVGCRERFRLSAVEGWTSRAFAVPLEFGSCFHNCLEFLQDGGRPENLYEVTEAYKHSKLKDPNNALNDEDSIELERLLGTVEIVVLKYMEYWNEVPSFQQGKRRAYDRDFKYLYQEETFNVSHILPTGRNIRLRGRWDAVLRHPFSGSPVLQENKTKGMIDEQGLLEGLKKDLQTQFYLWTLYLTLGKIPTHILYNVIRRPGLRPRSGEPLKDFLNRVDEDIDKRPSHYFMRWVVDIERKDLEDFVERTLNPLLLQVSEWWDSVKHDPFSPWTLQDGGPNLLHYERPYGIYDSTMFGNGRGEFFDVLYQNNFKGYFQRTEAFPELID